jgi:hypothetical protein
VNRKATPSIIITLFILLALPTISLYYSFKGASLRKIAMQELAVKGELPTQLASFIHSEASLRLIGSVCPDTFAVKSLIEQFLPEKMLFVFVNDSAFYSRYDPATSEKWVATGKVKLVNSISNSDSFLSTPCSFILTDDKNQILHTYDFRESLQQTRLVEHVALLVTKK